MSTGRNTRYAHITRNCFINAPFDYLEKGLLDLFLTHELRPEIGLEGDCLWSRDRAAFSDVAGRLADKGLACTLHAPFFDLAPGGVEPRILEISREKLRRTFSLIDVFRPVSIVCHLGYEEKVHSYKMEQWLETSAATWNELLPVAAAAGVRVMFENTYEPAPDIHLALFERLNGSNFGFCLDVGHLMAFGDSSLELWLDRLGDRLGQVHLHDNHGNRDEHLAIGRGCFDFPGLFEKLRRDGLDPLITLEPHSEDDLWGSLEAIHSMKLFGDDS